MTETICSLCGDHSTPTCHEKTLRALPSEECHCEPFVYYGAVDPGSLEPDCPFHGVVTHEGLIEKIARSIMEAQVDDSPDWEDYIKDAEVAMDVFRDVLRSQGVLDAIWRNVCFDCGSNVQPIIVPEIIEAAGLTVTTTKET